MARARIAGVLRSCAEARAGGRRRGWRRLPRVSACGAKRTTRKCGCARMRAHAALQTGNTTLRCASSRWQAGAENKMCARQRRSCKKCHTRTFVLQLFFRRASSRRLPGPARPSRAYRWPHPTMRASLPPTCAGLKLNGKGVTCLNQHPTRFNLCPPGEATPSASCSPSRVTLRALST